MYTHHIKKRSGSLHRAIKLYHHFYFYFSACMYYIITTDLSLYAICTGEINQYHAIIMTSQNILH